MAAAPQSVIIIGGGNVGLSLALCLAFYGIQSTLIEKNAYPTVSPNDDRRAYLDSRNTALSRRTVEIYRKIGLWDRLVSHACRIDTVEIYEKNGFGRATLKKDAEGVDSFGYVMENAHLGFSLLMAVKDSPLITLIEEAKVINIVSHQKTASVMLENGQTLTANLVLACDGQGSLARELLGIGASEYDYGQTAIVGVVKTDKPHQHTAIECFSPLGPLALLPLDDETKLQDEQTSKGGSYRSVVWICRRGDEERYLKDDERFLSEIQATFGEQAGRFLQAGRRGAYPLNKVLADRQVMGCCVLLGNAAHTLHPVAGQGFNLCMRDVDTLAMCLDDAKRQGRDFGDDVMLRAYEQRRLKDQKRVIFFCDAVVRGFSNANPFVKLVRNIGLLIFEYVPGIKPMVARFAMGLKS